MTTQKKLRLTRAMLDAIIEAQAIASAQTDEGDYVDFPFAAMSRAAVWAHQELRRRDRTRKRTERKPAGPPPADL